MPNRPARIDAREAQDPHVMKVISGRHGVTESVSIIPVQTTVEEVSSSIFRARFARNSSLLHCLGFASEHPARLAQAEPHNTSCYHIVALPARKSQRSACPPVKMEPRANQGASARASPLEDEVVGEKGRGE